MKGQTLVLLFLVAATFVAGSSANSVEFKRIKRQATRLFGPSVVDDCMAGCIQRANQRDPALMTRLKKIFGNPRSLTATKIFGNLDVNCQMMSLVTGCMKQCGVSRESTAGKAVLKIFDKGLSYPCEERLDYVKKELIPCVKEHGRSSEALCDESCNFKLSKAFELMESSFLFSTKSERFKTLEKVCTGRRCHEDCYANKLGEKCDSQEIKYFLDEVNVRFAKASIEALRDVPLIRDEIPTRCMQEIENLANRVKKQSKLKKEERRRVSLLLGNVKVHRDTTLIVKKETDGASASSNTVLLVVCALLLLVGLLAVVVGVVVFRRRQMKA